MFERKDDPSRKRISFSYREGNKKAAFYMDYSSIVSLGKRITNTLDFLRENRPEDIEEYDKLFKEKISYILGYRAERDLFCDIAPTEMIDGKFFFQIVLETITDALSRKKAEMVAAFTAKYN